MSNEPTFDPLNPTPEQEADMTAGYLAAGGSAPKPDLASMAFEHGWRMRRNDIAGIADDDQRALVARMIAIRNDAEARRRRFRSALKGPQKQFKL